MTLDEAPIGASFRVADIGGERAFRRRIMELGLLPGTEVEVIARAPLGDPLQLRIRGGVLSFRRQEARTVSLLPHLSQ